MIILKVDDKIIGYNNVLYHYQKKPRPGGCKYIIIIDLEEEKLIKVFERMSKRKVHDKFFCNEILKFYYGSFNLVQWTLDYLDDKNFRPRNVKWVFNNIENVEIKNSQLFIHGIASKWIENFV